MAWFRTLMSIVALAALVASACMPVAYAGRTGEPTVSVVTASAEPCAATHGVKRCDLKALPIQAVQPVGTDEPSGSPSAHAATSRHGVWPEVEPHPPRN